jgi:hypothetical protein
LLSPGVARRSSLRESFKLVDRSQYCDIRQERLQRARKGLR